MPQQVSLLLNGKRVVSYTVIDEGESSPSLVEGSQTVLVDTREIDIIKESAHPFFYYEAGKVLPLDIKTASVNKASIKNDNVDSFDFTLETNEPVSVYIEQVTGKSSESIRILREPVDGLVSVSMTSNLLGYVKCFAEGETFYTEELIVPVTEEGQK